jgi:hypothetical protein
MHCTASHTCVLDSDALHATIRIIVTRPVIFFHHVSGYMAMLEATSQKHSLPVAALLLPAVCHVPGLDHWHAPTRQNLGLLHSRQGGHAQAAGGAKRRGGLHPCTVCPQYIHQSRGTA